VPEPIHDTEILVMTISTRTNTWNWNLNDDKQCTN